MKKISSIILITSIIAASCGKKEESTDKKALLADLQGQATEIQAKIQSLQDEIALTDTSTTKEAATMVAVQPITLGVFNHYVEIQGKVETDNNVMISGETPGIIKNVNIKRGDKVRQGQVLAEVDATLTKKAIDQIKGNLELATTMFEKQEKLWKDNVGTEVQYLTAKNGKENLESQLATLNEQLKKAKISSPMDGIVDEIYKKEGEMLAPGLPVFKIVNLSDFKIQGELSESYISKVNVGDEVQVYFPDLDKTLNQKISVVGSAVNTLNRTFTIDIKIPTTADVKPNLVAYLKIKDFSKAKSVSVPINTVQSDRKGTFVYVAVGGVATKKPVKIAETYGSFALINEGLAEGDQLITFGYSDLTEGQAVKF